GVVDDATLDEESFVAGHAVEAAFNADDSVIHVTGSVARGQTATLTYTVTVNPNGERSDDLVANFLLPAAEEPPQDPTVDPLCEPADPQRDDCTLTPIGSIDTSRAVSADTDPVSAGTVLTYTLTFANNSRAAAHVDH